MKIALFSDVHGNYRALEAVLEDIRKQQVDQVIVLGDLVFKGPEPSQCVNAVQSLGVPVVRGNIDELVGEGVIQLGFARNEAHRQALLTELEWTRGQLSAEQLQFLRTLPMMCHIQLPGGKWLRCVHATPTSVLDVVLPTAMESELEAKMFSLECAEMAVRIPDFLAYGHIHVPYSRWFNGRLLFNTGSVGLPFDGDWRASYALLTADDEGYSSLEIRRVPYPIHETIDAYRDSGHPFADSVVEAIRAGRKPK